MRRNYGNTAIGILGAVIVAVSLIVFFLLDIERAALHWWALAFLLFAETVVCLGLINVKAFSDRNGGVFARSGITTVLIIYLLAALTSVLFAGVFTHRLSSFIILELGIIVLFLIAVISIAAFARRIGDSDRRIESECQFMETCESRISALRADIKHTSHKDKLETLYESIKYSDKLGASSVDQKILARITELEKALPGGGNGEENIVGIFDEISTLINQRKAEIGRAKRGGF